MQTVLVKSLEFKRGAQEYNCANNHEQSIPLLAVNLQNTYGGQQIDFLSYNISS